MPPHTNFRSLLHEAAGSLFGVIFPTRCSLCNSEVANAGGLGVCAACWSRVEAWDGISCERCGLPIVSERATDAAQVLCEPCRVNEPSFDSARGYGIYRENLRLLVLQLKFGRRERLGRRLGALLAQAWGKLDGTGDGEALLIVPVPLFSSRERERGFNQARLLAQGLKARFGKLPEKMNAKIETGVLVRTRPTLPQAGLKFQARQENVRGAFAVVNPERVRGRSILLVDDVMTTGATLSACAAALKKGGAARVYGLALARATPQFPDMENLPLPSGVDEFRHDWT